jgi:hypothetical protein
MRMINIVLLPYRIRIGAAVMGPGADGSASGKSYLLKLVFCFDSGVDVGYDAGH